MANPLDDLDATLAWQNTQLAQGASPQANGLRRQNVGRTTAYDEGGAAANTAREVGATATRFAGVVPATVGAGQAVLGMDKAAQNSFAAVKGLNQRADAMDSSVNSNIMEAGSLSEGLAAVRKLAIGSAPHMAAAVVGGLSGRGIARRTAMNAERREIARRIADDMSANGVQSPLARQAVQLHSERTMPRAATPAVSERQFDDTIDRVAGAAASRMPGVQKRVDTAGNVGTALGATAASAPGMFANNNEAWTKAVADDADPNARYKLLGADLAAAGISSVPVMGLFKRFGNVPGAQESLAKSIGMVLPRIAGATAGQAVSEGANEVAQAVIQRQGHKWVDDNVQMLSPEAMDEYVASFVGGAVLGGAMGGVAGSASQVPVGWRALREGGGATADAVSNTYNTLRDTLANSDWLRKSRDAAAARASQFESSPLGARASEAAAGAADRFRQARDGVSAAARSMGEKLGMFKRDRDAEVLADDIMDQFDSAPLAEDSGRPTSRWVSELSKDFTDKWAMTSVDQGWLDGLDKAGAQQAHRALSALAHGGELSPRDVNYLMHLVETGRTTMAKLDKLAGAGPLLTQRVGRLSDSVGNELDARTADVGQNVDMSRQAAQEDGDNDYTDGETDVSDPTMESMQLGDPVTKDRELAAVDRYNSMQRGDAGPTRYQVEQAARADLAEAKRNLYQGTRDRLNSGPNPNRDLPLERFESASTIVEISDAIREERAGVASPQVLERLEQQYAAATDAYRKLMRDRDEGVMGQAERQRAVTDARQELDAAGNMQSSKERAQEREATRLEAIESYLGKQGFNPDAPFTSVGEDGKSRTMHRPLRGSSVYVKAVDRDGKVKPEVAKGFNERAKMARFVKLTKPVDFQAVGRDGAVIEKREGLIDLASLISKTQARMRAEGTSNEDISPRAALLRALGDLHTLRAGIDWNSLTPGDIARGEVVIDPNGKAPTHAKGEVVYRLTQRDVEMLQRRYGSENLDVQEDGAPTTDEKGRLNQPKPKTPARPKLSLNPEAKDKRNNPDQQERLDKDFARSEQREQEHGEGEPESMSDDAKRVAREAPGSNGVTTIDVITDAKAIVPSQYEAALEALATVESRITVRDGEGNRTSKYKPQPKDLIEDKAARGEKLTAAERAAQMTSDEAAMRAEYRKKYGVPDMTLGEAKHIHAARVRAGTQLALAEAKMLRADGLLTAAQEKRLKNALENDNNQVVTRQLQRIDELEANGTITAKQAKDDRERAQRKGAAAESFVARAERNSLYGMGAAIRHNKADGAAVLRENGDSWLYALTEDGEYAGNAVRERGDSVSTGLLDAAEKVDKTAHSLEVRDRHKGTYEKHDYTRSEAQKKAVAAQVKRLWGNTNPIERNVPTHYKGGEVSAIRAAINEVYGAPEAIEAMFANGVSLGEIGKRIVNLVRADQAGREEQLFGDPDKEFGKTKLATIASEVRDSMGIPPRSDKEAFARWGQSRSNQIAAAERRLSNRNTRENNDPTGATRKKDVERTAEAKVQAGVRELINSPIKEVSNDRLRSETTMIRQVMHALGMADLANMIDVVPASTVGVKDGNGQFGNRGSRYYIAAGSGLSARERLDVLMHETGHAIAYGHLLKAAGVSPTDATGIKNLGVGSKAIADVLAETDTKLGKALRADYEQWLQSNNYLTTVGNLRLSRGTPARAAGQRRRLRKAGVANIPVGQLTAADYHLSFDEWLADNISRALQQDKRATGIVAEFFQELADALERVYRMLVGAGAIAEDSDGKRSKWKPAPSVQEWISGSFDQNVAVLRATEGVVTTPEKAAKVVAAAVASKAAGPGPAAAGPATNPPAPPKAKQAGNGGKPPKGPPEVPPEVPPAPKGPPMDIEGTMEYIREFVPAESRKRLYNAFRANIVALRRAFPHPAHLDMMTDADTGMEATIALGYWAWKNGQIGTGEKAYASLIGIQESLAEKANVATTGHYANRILTDMATGKLETFKSAGKVYDPVALEARTRGKLNKALDQANKLWESAMRPVNRVIGGIGQDLRDSGIPALRSIAAQLYRVGGTTGEDRGLVRSVTHQAAARTERFQKILGPLTATQQRRVIRLLQEQANNARLDGKITDKGHVNFGKHRYPPEVRKAVREMRAYMDDMFQYMEEAGVQVGYRKNFFPLLLDINNERAAAELKAVLSDPVYENSIMELFNGPDEDARAEDPDEYASTLESNIDALVKGAMRGEENLEGSGGTKFASENFRLMEFIYRLREDAAKARNMELLAHHNALVKRFAKLQVHDPAQVVSRYVMPAVRRAEYVRRFGVTAQVNGKPEGVKLTAMLEEAEKQGASDEQIKHARLAVEAAIGTYGQVESPTISMLSPALAKKLAGPRTKSFIAGAQAYQNVRLMPLALLSSLVDPMGIVVRGGGDSTAFKASWDGFVQGMRTLTNGATREQLSDMMRLLGTSEEIGNLEALQQQFGGFQANNSFSSKVNDFVFKVNGMSGWTRTTRYMAVLAGHRFLIERAAQAKNHMDAVDLVEQAKGTARGENIETQAERANRYLQELGLTPEDIQTETVIDPNGKERLQVKLLTAEEMKTASEEEIDANNRVRAALLQFVDEAILRPNSQQRPQWHNDPYMGLVTQYKSFAYAIYDQVWGRMMHEVEHGNNRVYFGALAYLPIVIMAEMLRNVLQGDSDDTEDWDMIDWASLGIERAGLYSPGTGIAIDVVGDVQSGRGVLSSQIGPSASQAIELSKASYGQYDLGKTFESALPASALHRKWNDD